MTPPAADPHAEVRVDVEGRTLRLRRLDKVLYPSTGTTKGEVLDYYARIAPLLLPHLARRPVTRKRWPDGVSGPSFFEKNLPRGTPDWVERVTLPTPGSSTGRDVATFPLVQDVATLVWLVNLASLELHVPQWQVGPRGALKGVDRLVIDLDPGAPAGLAECCEVALMVRERVEDAGLTVVPVTSGSKGMQLYAPLSGRQDADTVRGYAERLAVELAAERPQLVVSRMTKALRPGKVLLDWSQNHGAKTTISPYALRGREAPNAAAPRSWDEIEAGGLTQLSIGQVLERTADGVDLAADLLARGPSLR
jgi:bifunctional non-homologous end joining protein LigD